MEKFSRTALLIGEKGLEKLKNSKVIVFGVGGVGGYTVEALARSGVGNITVVDDDVVSVSNINRQIIATVDTVGKDKVEVIKERILSINPDCNVTVHNIFFDESVKEQFNFSKYDYVIDAIDSLGAKIELIASAKASETPIISAMGAGNKLDPTQFEVSDISKTQVCPLARAVRTSLKKRGIYNLKVVYSKENPVVPPVVSDGETRRVPASISFVPSSMGLIIAGEVAIECFIPFVTANLVRNIENGCELSVIVKYGLARMQKGERMAISSLVEACMRRPDGRSAPQTAVKYESIPAFLIISLA